jgi:hypothetical protein
MNENITCPFCNETDFDLIGLKRHFLRDWCDVFNITDPPQIWFCTPCKWSNRVGDRCDECGLTQQETGEHFENGK